MYCAARRGDDEFRFEPHDDSQASFLDALDELIAIGAVKDGANAPSCGAAARPNENADQARTRIRLRGQIDLRVAPVAAFGSRQCLFNADSIRDGQHCHRDQ